MENNYDFMAIGDTVTDAFIELQDARITCSVDKEKCEICMKFADKIPYKDVHIVPAVGNSANAAVSASRLGLKSALLTNLGDDYYAEETLTALRSNGVGTDFVKKNAGKKTNYHYVLLFEGERTILVKHEPYDYKLPNIGNPRWIYLSSLGENSLPYHLEIEKYLGLRPEIKLAFQPGTYQIKFGKDALKAIYARTEIFFCNKEEAQKILETEEEDIKKLLKMVAELGPKLVVITDGPKGAYVYDSSTNSPQAGTFWKMPMYPDPQPPIDRTGAGDAFSSAFTTAIIFGLGVEDALGWGPINSMSVVQYIGAREGLLSREQIERFLAKAPDYYRPEKI